MNKLSIKEAVRNMAGWSITEKKNLGSGKIIIKKLDPKIKVKKVN